LVDLVAVFFDVSKLIFIAKPLLMPSLVLELVYAGVTSNKKLVLAGLFFSWMGDIFLLFESINPLFFIFGLISFLFTHVCYIIFFLSTSSAMPSLLKKQPIYILLILSYGTGLVWLLFPHLGKLQIPVILYSVVICSMLLCSIHIYLKVKEPANRYYVSGAAFFVLSDSLLAIDKFYHTIPFAGIWVMLSYCMAQYFIVRGFIEWNVSTK